MRKPVFVPEKQNRFGLRLNSWTGYVANRQQTSLPCGRSAQWWNRCL